LLIQIIANQLYENGSRPLDKVVNKHCPIETERHAVREFSEYRSIPCWNYCLLEQANNGLQDRCKAEIYTQRELDQVVLITYVLTQSSSLPVGSY